MNKKSGFTLAEILITLLVVGVVAVMTIPTLITKINNIIMDNQVKVFNAKLIKGLNLTKTAGDLNNTYDSTYDFLVNALSKNLKMAKICDKDHIRDCIPYDKIKYNRKSGIEKVINIKDIKTADKLQLFGAFSDVAAFILADGTPAIVSYNLKCIDDPDKADTGINGCLAGIFDINGNRKPNRFGTKIETSNGKEIISYINDLRPFNGARIGASCIGEVDETCFVSSTIGGNSAAYNTLFDALKEIDPDYTRPLFKYNGSNANDNWQLGKDYCEKVIKGKLPSSKDLTKVTQILRDSNSDKTSVFAALGITDNPSQFGLYLNSAPNAGAASNLYYFVDSGIAVNDVCLRYEVNRRVVCVGE